MYSATCAAERRRVSLVHIVESNELAPRLSAVSNNGPPRINRRRCRFGRRRSGWISKRAPFGILISVKSACPAPLAVEVTGAGADAVGFNEIEVSRVATR